MSPQLAIDSHRKIDVKHEAFAFARNMRISTVGVGDYRASAAAVSGDRRSEFRRLKGQPARRTRVRVARSLDACPASPVPREHGRKAAPPAVTDCPSVLRRQGARRPPVQEARSFHGNFHSEPRV